MDSQAEAWWYVAEDGSPCSVVYPDKQQADAALADLRSPQAQLSPRYRRPARLVSSRGRSIMVTEH